MAAAVGNLHCMDGNRRLSKLFGITLLGVSLLLGVVVLSGGDIPVDRLYALYLDHVPTADDWARALPRPVQVRGGKVNAPKRLGDIDDDTVHTSTPSCHHGSSLPSPVEVDMRAFYTDTDLYLRLSWADATGNDRMLPWRYDGTTWQSQPQIEDGFGLMWDTFGQSPQFTCSVACHIDDFGVAGSSFHARNRMKLARPGSFVDLWHWKAERTGRYGFVDDRYLDDKGMHGDIPGELFRPNSIAAGSDRELFVPPDQPLLDAEGKPADAGFHPNGALAPGYVTERPVGGRADIAATSHYQDGRWVVTLHRRLSTGDPHDIVFIPGDEAGAAFGLSLMDSTLYEHFASTVEERLVLLPRSAAAATGGE